MNEATKRSDSEDLQRLAETSARQACRSLFLDYGVSLEDLDPSSPTDEPLLLTAVIGLTGPGVRASCILACTDSPLEDSKPAEGSSRDWIAELSNQLAGRLKSLLLQHGAEMYLTTPVVIRGDHLAPLPRFALQPIAFAAEPGRVYLWVEAHAEPSYRLSDPSEPPAESGEMLLF